MSNVNPDKAFDRAVELVVHADQVTNMWTGRLVAIQTSLVVAEGALLAFTDSQPSPVILALVGLIGVVAIAMLFALNRIITREHNTGHGYIAMVKRAEGNDPSWGTLFHISI